MVRYLLSPVIGGRMRLLVAIAVLAAALVGASTSEGGWKVPKNLSPPGEDAQSPQVAIGGDGTTVVAWRRFDGTQPATPCCYRA